VFDVVWQIKGCVEALEDPQSDVCSVYSSKYINNVNPTLHRLKAGNAVFTFPVTPIKCAGAAQKICYIAEDLATKVINSTELQISKSSHRQRWKNCLKKKTFRFLKTYFKNLFCFSAKSKF